MDVSIIFVNWNSVGFLKEAVSSIYQFTHAIQFEIIVVDNASAEPGLEGLIGDFPSIKLIRSPENLGFSRANNLGFENSSGKYLLFLNPDTKLTTPAINIMLKAIEQLPDAGALGCKLLNTDLSLQTSCVQPFPSIWNQITDTDYVQDRWLQRVVSSAFETDRGEQSVIGVEMVSGACLMIERSAFAKAGMFSDEYFMYADDLDLCFKLSELGRRNYFVPAAVVIHHGGKSAGRKVRGWAVMAKFNSISKFFRKTRGPVYAGCYRLAMGVVAAVRLVILSIMLLTSSLIRGRQSIKGSMVKWSAVLRWSAGLSGSVLQH
jgi:N-acetylglucosaminyl-diphospho-decaprenol L-rhamnosyltransferase